MGKKSKTKQKAIENYFPFVLILPLLLLPAFFRGLFFDRELLVAHMYTALVLIAYAYHRRDNFKISLNLMDTAFVGLVISFFLSAFVAYNVRDGVGEFLKVFNYFLVFFILSRLAVNIQKMRLALLAVFLSGFGVALAGIGTAYGTFWFNGAFVDGLINSTLQYHNGAAIFLMACGILGLYLASSSHKQWQRLTISGINFLIFITAFGAGSRGAMLMGPIAFVLLFIGLPKGFRGKAFLSLISIIIPFVLLSKLILDFSGSALPWLFLFLGIGTTALIHFGLEAGLNRIKLEINSKKIWIGLAIGFLLAITVVFNFSEEIMPQGISERLHNFNLQQNSVQERFTFYKDAMKIVEDHPVFGVGGGGWNTLYRQYQSYLYHSTEVHNHPLQVWVEAGTIGFIFLILLYLSSFKAMYNVMRSQLTKELKALAWVAFSTGTAVFLHSLIDFSLSEGAISILLWSQLGLIRATELQGLEEKTIVNLKPMGRKILGIFVGGALFISSFLLYLGDYYGVNASNAMRLGNLQQATGNLEKAVKFDPMNSMLRIQLAQVYSYQAQQNRNFYLSSNAFSQAKKAVELNPTSENYLLAAQAAAGIGNVGAIVNYAESAVELAPLRQETYINLAMMYLNAGRIYINQKQPDNAKAVLKKIDTIPEKMEKIMASKTETEKSLWKGSLLGVDDRFKQIQNEAEKLLLTL